MEEGSRPIDHVSELMAEFAESKSTDWWGQPFGITYGEVGLEEGDPAELLFIEISSPGPDGELGTEDDIAFWMSLLGEFNDGAFMHSSGDD